MSDLGETVLKGSGDVAIDTVLQRAEG